MHLAVKQSESNGLIPELGLLVLLVFMAYLGGPDCSHSQE